MKNWQSKIEDRLSSFGHLIHDKALLFLAITLLFIVAVGSNLPKTTMDTSIEGFLHENDKALIDYNNFKELFGQDNKILVTVQSDKLFTQKSLEALSELHTELENNTPHLYQIDSLVNIRDTMGKNDSLYTDDFLMDIPSDKNRLEELKKRGLDKYIYKDMILSQDGRFTNIIITLNTYKTADISADELMGGFDTGESTQDSKLKREYLSQDEITASIKQIEKIVKPYKKDFEIHIAGSPIVDTYLKEMMQKDIQKFIKIIILTIVVLLFVLFRRVFAVILPIVSIVLSVVCTMGFMAYFGVPIKMPTQILPSFLLAVGVGASVHFLAIFIKEYNKTHDKRASIAYTYAHSGLAIIMTSITTAFGLFSFSASEILPVADLGVFASLGIMMALLFTLVLLPALIAILPIKPKDVTNSKIESIIDNTLIAISRFAVQKSKAILVVSAIIIAVSVTLATKLEFSHNALKWLPQDYEARKATELIDKELRGTVSIELLIDTAKENGLHEPDILNKIDNLQKYLMSLKSDEYYVGKAWSIVEIIKETNQALHNNDPKHYTIPQDKDLVSQELFLFENSGSDDLEDVVDSQFSMARVTIKVPWIDATKYTDLLQKIESAFDKEFGDSAKLTITGIAPIFNKTIDASIKSSATSYIMAFGVITIMMILLVSDIRLGLVSMIPNLTPIIFILSIMYIFDMKLDMFTMLIGSIAIGIVVDDTIHFMHNFKRYYEQSGDIEYSVEMTLMGTGRAMLVTTIVLSAGFLVYILANMGNLVSFGILTAISIVMALVADFLLAPALMNLLAKKLIKQKKSTNTKDKK
jgi:hydrophobe/amphiphile efflux-3 (HAE3) family protein